MPISSVLTLINEWKIIDSVETKPQLGRPKEISSTTARNVLGDAEKNPHITSDDIKDSLEKVVWLLQDAQ